MRKTNLTAMVIGTTLYLARLRSNYRKRRVAEFTTEMEADAAGLALSQRIKRKNGRLLKRNKSKHTPSLWDRLRHVKTDPHDGLHEVLS